MPTKTKIGYEPKKAFYAYLGAGQFAADKAKELSGKAVHLANSRREAAVKLYEDLATRGEKIATSIRKSTYTKRALEQVKTARTQIKSARTSVRRAADTTAKATKEAAKAS
jgi:hypothetical protein